MVPPIGDALLRLGGERRHATVGRVDDERRLFGDALAEIPPETVVGAFDVDRRAAVASILVSRLDALLREVLGFFFRDGILAGELAGTFERCELREIPGALQIGTAVGRAGNGRCRGRGDETDDPQNGADPHGEPSCCTAQCNRTYGYQLSAISYQLSAISYQLSAISYQLSAIRYQLSAVSRGRSWDRPLQQEAES
ncbi:MAG: hypothetical protein DMG00_04020 [Acidobacteria bacterium]|nr:MAG: hypothetical protein DMG00_04020 [Acidobacteriota bacterium]